MVFEVFKKVFPYTNCQQFLFQTQPNIAEWAIGYLFGNLGELNRHWYLKVDNLRNELRLQKTITEIR